MSAPLSVCPLPSEAATTAYAQRWGAVLQPGDTVLLEGAIGAGKTHFARGLIGHKLAQPEDIPSPTFTLIQIYEAPDCEIWHCDLYRISGTSEVVELGLDEAMDNALCLIEWPDRLGDMAPASALTLSFETGANDTSRIVTVSGDSALWASRVPPCPA